MENSKPFTTLNHPLIVEHMNKILQLEVELMKQEGFDPVMILEYHLQLAAIAVVAGSQYNSEIVSRIFQGACEQLRQMCHKEIQNQIPSFVFPTSGTVM